MRKPFRILDFGFRMWGALLVVMLLTMPASATTIRKMDLPQLVAKADSILQGRVESVETRWENNLAYTYVSLRVDDPLKGERRRTVLIKQLGGRIGGLMFMVSGMPQFETGDQVIVFLKDWQDGTYDVVGLNQGKYEIVNDFAVANVFGLTLLDPKTGQMSDAGFVQKAPLEKFKAKIRELLR
ncbi:MAG: hypothetical protein HY646_21770 [Acidobacteria bacterium]|nr:hypothetical protein [Acidobacteriota bacterium]